ncbi:unnamed protein product [Trichobilharzia szidati]|nr:unnamed protein product [Trichobilharzia szidati]
MTQSNGLLSPSKRERYAASNTHRHHTLLSMTQKTSSELFKEVLSPEILLGKLPNVVENAPEPNSPYKPTCSIREEHGRPIYGVAFNSDNRSQPSDPLYFATVSGHYVTVYQCHLKDDVEDASSEDSSTLEPVSTLLTFADPAGDEEEFYCCAWSRDTSERSVFNSWGGCSESHRPRPTPHQGVNDFYSGSIIPPHQQIIAVAGKRGVIRILCPSMLSCLGSLVGHGGSINELKFHPKRLSLLFSFSKDYTIRLWNVATNVLICVFGGSEGHRAEVLHGDVSLSGNLLLSAGMDHYIKIWRLNTPELANSISESFDYRLHTNTRLVSDVHTLFWSVSMITFSEVVGSKKLNVFFHFETTSFTLCGSYSHRNILIVHERLFCEIQFRLDIRTLEPLTVYLLAWFGRVSGVLVFPSKVVILNMTNQYRINKQWRE